MYETVTTSGKDGAVDLQFTTFAELTNHLDATAVAQVVADMVNAAEGGTSQMLAVSPEDISEKHIGILALDASKHAADLPATPTELASRLTGFAGALDPINYNGHNMTEVGSLKVAETYRRRGIGTALFQAAVSSALREGLVPYAFCNPNSLPLAERIGGRQIAHASEVPPEAFGLCQECPMFQEALAKQAQDSNTIPCCDRVVIWDSQSNTPAAQGTIATPRLSS